ncbi:sialate O-acetylesterase [Bacteroides sp. 51]|uniref:sialate O-acetylesterase n=1 Tax=Bacteroides sp. 51 TaxID=2302938 RepID=UPI0013D2FF40|nr:sialate O-acetylesterase [Bacteroides sp. 51]NDV82733.1 9-O-acetylesterase [Bacteroides sp. 51]
MRKLFILLLLSVACLSSAGAKVVLPAYFTDNMILQQNTQVTFHGTATPGKPLTLKASWNNETYETRTGADGSWRIPVPTLAAGGPYTITINDGKKLQLNNILIGEVWFCSGQSNMEMPIAGWGKVMNYEKEIAEANYPSIRLFQVKKNTSVSPLQTLEANMGGWQECSPASVPEFSSVAYFYARMLWNELGIPIGVIDSTWGGTPAEAWTSYETLKDILGFQTEAGLLQKNGFDKAKMHEAYTAERAQWESLFKQGDEGFNGDAPQWANPTLDANQWKAMNLPGLWEDKGLNNFDGVVWFRKTIEIPSNWAGKAIQLSLAMIDDEDITYFNGVEIARGSGYTTPRRYTIPANLVKPGQSVLTVRVSDFGGGGGIHGEPAELYAEVNGKRISLAGDWKYNIGLSMANFPAPPISPTASSSYPTVLYNAMVHPLTQFPVQGAIWYQGEANVGRAHQYADLFPAMIADWRKQWGSNLSFYFVQLANYLERKPIQPDSEWAALREAQTRALHLEGTGMAVTIDVGEAHDIHPKNKQEVGRRLALAALAHTYGKKIVSSGPLYQSYTIEGNQVKIRFTHAQNGLKANGTSVKGFTMAGADHKFYPAQATIEGETVVVYAPEVSIPLAVRYGWADNPDCNLYNQDGLPASPFRTDAW